MTDSQLRDAIERALKQCKEDGANFPDKIGEILDQLGYEGDALDDTPRSGRWFVDEMVKKRGKRDDTNGEAEFAKWVESMNILRQLSDDDISGKLTGQANLPVFAGEKRVNKSDIESFVFLAVRLREKRDGDSRGNLKKRDGYSRGKYADFARLINKPLKMPAVIFFFAPTDKGAKVTVSFVGRRPSKRDDDLHVLEKVSLLRDIRCAKPHRGHLGILAALSLERRLKWIKGEGKDRNFRGLLAAWLDELDTEALNRRFYGELLDWFKRAVEAVSFPATKEKGKAQTPAKTKAEKIPHVIRMVNRILFIWFLKEKGLVAEELFEENEIFPLVKNGGRGDNYYRVVLQNLFFATLNTEIGNRGFRDDAEKKLRPKPPKSANYSDLHRNFSLWRYADLIAAPPAENRNALKGWFDRSPFVNGGLFDCLDGHKAEGRVDCFTDNKDKEHRQLLGVPDALFFRENKDAPGLFHILRRYKFTVAENTPTEQDVALDPELLGNVFENLLAEIDHIAEGQGNRGSTGAYYTPRAIVDYMVGESLHAYFMRRMKGKKLEARLRNVLAAETDYEHADEKLDEAQTEAFVDAAMDLRLLDPAVGSGAFPMGALTVLTKALERIDPQNIVLHERERKWAEKSGDEKIKKDALALVEDVFSAKNQYNNYARKLSLIRNSLFGVDISPTAAQICRLRFFITLAIEQVATDDKGDNFGFKPLPNLDARIIAADALIKLDSASAFPPLRHQRVVRMEEELREIRGKFFAAKTRREKNACEKADEAKRMELADYLKSNDYPEDAANDIANWDPYNQTDFAGWFDPEYMFGVADGFHIVIGNPPYIHLRANYSGSLADKYQTQNYATFARMGDIYCLFYEQGMSLLQANGDLCYISSNKFMRARYGKELRKFFREETKLRQIIDFGELPVFRAGAEPVIIISRKAAPSEKNEIHVATIKSQADLYGLPDTIRRDGFSIIQENLLDAEWTLASLEVFSLIDRLQKIGMPMSDYVDEEMYIGVLTGANKIFIIDGEKRQELINESANSEDLIKPYLCGGKDKTGDINRWRIVPKDRYVIFSTKKTNIDGYPAIKKYLSRFKLQLQARATQLPKYWYALSSPPSCYDKFSSPKIVYCQTSKSLYACVDYDGFYVNNTASMIFSEHNEYLLGILSSELMDFVYRHTFPRFGDSWNRGRPRYLRNYMGKIPIYEANDAERDYVASRIKRILADPLGEKGEDVPRLEAEIDARVYGFYGLTEAEIALVKAWQARRHAAEAAGVKRRRARKTDDPDER